MRNLATTAVQMNCKFDQNGTIKASSSELYSAGSLTRTAPDSLEDLRVWRRQQAARWDVEFGADATSEAGLVS